ncbi:MAG: hypothetical protein ACREDR_17535 [Blastocatellia bacterium]
MTLVRILLVLATALTTGWCPDRNSVLAKDRSSTIEDNTIVKHFEAAAASMSQAKPSGEQNYPIVISDSAERRTIAERDWHRMLDAYSAPDVAPDLYAVTYTPKSLPSTLEGMKITPAQSAGLEDGTGLREAAKIFLDRWRDLLDAGPEALSLISAAQTGNTTALTYRQANYPYPVVGEFGTLTLLITQDGRLKQIDDQFIPVVDLPNRPALDRNAVAERVIGRAFKASDSSGKGKTVSVTDAKQIAVKQIVVLPLRKPAAIEIHLAWQVDVTAETGCTVYVDAMNGETLVTPLEEKTRRGTPDSGSKTGSARNSTRTPSGNYPESGRAKRTTASQIRFQLT